MTAYERSDPSGRVAADRVPNPSRSTVGLDSELETTIHSGGFWRLVPESVPRVYDPITHTLLKDVERGLRRLIT